METLTTEKSKINKDFKELKKNKKKSTNVDEYIKFLDFSNKFSNHKKKRFKPIKGTFKI